ncbi:MAG: CBS domain-containing protein [Bdellovibrionales bacterium]|nr:CBS domain-containing protein [Bdellovibrionales bacterium]
MGTLEVKHSDDPKTKRAYMQSLLDDVRALELMLERGLIESGKRRVGAEQEFFLVDSEYQPAPLAMEVLEALNDEAFTTELGLFNLELNLPPFDCAGSCLSDMEKLLNGKLRTAREKLATFGGHVVLTGILPTLHKSHASADYMTPKPRYRALEEVLKKLRGPEYEVNIKGVDELRLVSDTVMLEACNASFQVHLQVDPHAFAKMYNIAELVTAPIIAAATNSPVLFSKRLWNETRVAVFQNSVDTRRTSAHLRELRPRVSFGQGWIESSVLEIFRDDISRFKTLFNDIEEKSSSVAMVENGEIPKLKALALHNGTVWRWNRACYGVSDGVAHLRIENRILPSGPSVIDEMANVAFWLGMMFGIEQRYGDPKGKIPFEDVRDNFESACKQGLATELYWFDGSRLPAQDLILNELIPLAKESLLQAGLSGGDVARYLGIIEERVSLRRTGADWMLNSIREFPKGGASRAEKLAALTAATVNEQVQNKPVHRWKLAAVELAGNAKENYVRVEQYMTTDLYTVSEEESIELVANLMDWNKIRHVLVEDEDHNLTGIVSYRAILRHFANMSSVNEKVTVPVKDLMRTNPQTITPETSTLDALKMMREQQIACLPVTKDGKLIGVVTEADFASLAGELLIQKLQE